MNWDPPLKPAEHAETRLIEAILEGHFPIGSVLPAERELALQLGVTRPTLRETLQRMARDGWIEIRHGRPTRVRDYWQEGNLAVLACIARQSDHIPSDFVANLLSVRQLLAPAYTRLAVERAAVEIGLFIEGCRMLEDTAEAYTAFDWQLHHRLSIASGNPVFPLILNGFADLYHLMGGIYFESAKARKNSCAFYTNLLQAVRAGDAPAAEGITARVMADSLSLWQAVVSQT